MTFRVICILIIIPMLSACANNVMPENLKMLVDQNKTFSAVQDYLIGVEDKLQVDVWRNPDLSVSVPVRPDGKISVPLIGDVAAGGKKPEQVANEIKLKLAKFIREPQVTVILIELKSHEFISRIRVTGAVQTPMSVPFRQGMTVLDAVLEAGGLNEFSSPNRAQIYRKDENNIVQKYDILLGDILNSGALETNYMLRPSDIITVPERFF